MAFPQELIDLIIDELRQAGHAGNSALVSRAWVLRNRYHTFRNITIRPETMQSLADIVTAAPMTRSLIHTCTIECGGDLLDPELSHLTLFDTPFTKTTSLVVKIDDDIAYDQEGRKLEHFHTAIMGIFLPFTFPALRHLYIECEMLHAEVIHRMISAFSSLLHYLFILGNDIVTDESEDLAMIKLSELRACTFDVFNGKDHLLKSLDPPTLPQQVMVFLSQETRRDPPSALAFVKADVEILSISASDLELALIPTRLRRLVIHDPGIRDQYFLRVLGERPLEGLVEIQLIFTENEDQELEEFPWGELDSAVELPRLEHLSSLGIQYGDFLDLPEEIRQAMPIAEGRGILRTIRDSDVLGLPFPVLERDDSGYYTDVTT